MSDELKFLCRCPCGRELKFDEESKAVYHEEPPCREFEFLNYVDFLKWVKLMQQTMEDLPS